MLQPSVGSLDYDHVTHGSMSVEAEEMACWAISKLCRLKSLRKRFLIKIFSQKMTSIFYPTLILA